MLTKICKGCGEELPATNEYFNLQTKGKYGLNSKCKKCVKKNYEEHKEQLNASQREYYKANREKILERAKVYNKNNREKINARYRIYYRIYAEKNKERISKVKKAYAEKNKEKILKYAKEYKLNNKDKIAKYNNENSEKIKLKHREYYSDNKEKILKQLSENYRENKEIIKLRSKNYYNNNKEIVKAKRKEYWELNKETIRAKDRIYSKTHRDVRNIASQRRRIKEKEMPKSLTTKQWKEIKIKFNNRCCYCGKETQLTQDHFIPLTKGGEYTLNNIVPCCKSCNSSKHNSEFKEWYRRQAFYSREREKFILKYLEYKEETQQLKLI